MTLRIIFAGTPEIAATHLQALLEAKHDVVAVYSQPDRPSGRGKKLQASPVKTLALKYNLPVLQPVNFKNSDDVNALAAFNADIMVVVAYGLLLPINVLQVPRLGCINVHASLLPRWRGAAPIERAIEAGDATTGITIMQMDVGLDTGDMLHIVSIPISHNTTGDSLRHTMGEIGSEALLHTLELARQQQLKPITQNNALANYASKLTKEEAQLDWTLSAIKIDQKIRAFTSANVCYSLYKGERVKIWQASICDNTHNAKSGSILSITKKGLIIACGEGAIIIQQLQLPNANKMDVAAILNGRKDYFVEGTCFE